MSRWLVISLLLTLGWLPQALLAQQLAGPREVGFEALDSLMRQEARPVAVFLHADWCRYCQHMKRTTFQDETVRTLLDSAYYFISFNGESREPVDWRGRRYLYRPRGRDAGVHALAEALGTMDDGTFTYPTFVLLNARYEIVFQYNAFLSADSMRRMLQQGR